MPGTLPSSSNLGDPRHVANFSHDAYHSSSYSVSSYLVEPLAVTQYLTHANCQFAMKVTCLSTWNELAPSWRIPETAPKIRHISCQYTIQIVLTRSNRIQWGADIVSKDRDTSMDLRITIWVLESLIWVFVCWGLWLYIYCETCDEGVVRV